MVYGGPMIWELRDGATIMRWFRQTSEAEDEFCVFLGLQVIPPGDPFPKEHWTKKMCVLVVWHDGTRPRAKRRQRMPRRCRSRSSIGPADAVPGAADPVRWAASQGLQWYWKGDFVKTLPDAAIEAHVAHAAKLPSALSGMHLYPIDGAVQRQKRDATAWDTATRPGRW